MFLKKIIKNQKILKKADKILQRISLWAGFALFSFIVIKGYLFYQSHQLEFENFFFHLKEKCIDFLEFVDGLDAKLVIGVLFFISVAGMVLVGLIQNNLSHQNEDEECSGDDEYYDFN